jgi:hypothetical protein
VIGEVDQRLIGFAKGDFLVSESIKISLIIEFTLQDETVGISLSDRSLKGNPTLD